MIEAAGGPGRVDGPGKQRFAGHRQQVLAWYALAAAARRDQAEKTVGVATA